MKRADRSRRDLAERGRARREARLALLKLWKTTAAQRFFSADGAAATHRRRPRRHKANVRSVVARCRTKSKALLSAPRGSGAPEVLGARTNAAGPRGLRSAFHTSGASRCA